MIFQARQKGEKLVIIDLAAGIGTYAVLSMLFGKPLSLIMVSATIVFAFLPDIDFIPFFFLRKRLKLVSHHIIHFPLLFLPAMIFLAFAADGYTTLLYSLPVAFHFLHDSTRPTGIRWLGLPGWLGGSFLPDTSYTLTWRGFKTAERDKILAGLAKNRDKRSIKDEIFMRLEKPGPKGILFLSASIMLFLIHVYLSMS